MLSNTVNNLMNCVGGVSSPPGVEKRKLGLQATARPNCSSHFKTDSLWANEREYVSLQSVLQVSSLNDIQLYGACLFYLC